MAPWMGFDAMYTSKNCFFFAFCVIDRDFFILLHLIILTGHCVLPDTPTGFVMQPELNHFSPSGTNVFSGSGYVYSKPENDY